METLSSIQKRIDKSYKTWGKWYEPSKILYYQFDSSALEQAHYPQKYMQLGSIAHQSSASAHSNFKETC